jgi:4-hydroxybenzoate polyprenyltransferase
VRLTLKQVAIVARPFWWVNTAMPFVAAYWIINQNVDATLVIGIFYFAFAYNFLMYGVNDIFDYESDIRNPRKTGIDGSVMDKKLHPQLWFWMLAINIPALIWLYLQGSLITNAWLSLMVFMVFAYSVKGLRFKEIPFLDSFTSSFHYTSPYIYGALLIGAEELYVPAYGAFFVWVMANHAFGAIQDITPDREAGISSIAAKLGAAHTIVFVFILYILAALLPIASYGWHGAVGAILLSPYVFIVARTLPQRHNDQAPAFGQAWRQFLYCNYAVGFVLTIILLVSFKPFS